MSPGKSRTEPAGSVERSPRRRDRLRWADIASLALLELVVAVPTMAVEESWHGHPMIDQPSRLWMVPAFLVIAAFLAGGALAGYRHPSAAVRTATAAAALGVAVLVVGAVIRRIWVVHEGVPLLIAFLWFSGGVLAVLLSAAGSELGRRLARSSR